MRKFFFLIISIIYMTAIPIYGFNHKHIVLKMENSRKTIFPPTVDFSFTNAGTCSGTPITFTPSISGDAPYTYLWDFGDGNTSTNSNPTHSFASVGCGSQSFNVQLTVTDNFGLKNSTTKIISVQQKPNLKFVNLNAPTGSSAPFEKCGDNNTDVQYTINVGNTLASSPCISSYNVNWGDGSTETNVNFPRTHTYNKLGSFNMVITGIGNSCNNTITYVIKNSNNPIGALIAPGNTINLCIPISPMEFAIGSWALNPSDTKYQVNYGDGTIKNFTQTQLESSPYFNSSNPPASLNYPIPHTFNKSNCPSGSTVNLKISTSCGDTNLTAGSIIILDVPKISFSVQSIACVNSSVYFSNTTFAGYKNDCSTVNVYT